MIRVYAQVRLHGKKLSKSERKDFGLPDKKKYPMPDKEHVRKAIQMFNYAKPSDWNKLANNIMKYMDKYKMNNTKISKDTNFGKIYYSKKG